MRLLRTLRRSRGDHPVLAWAFRYALAAVVVGAGILLIGPSPGVGWALVVFGGCLATLTSGSSTRRGGQADPGTERKALTPNDFGSLEELAERLLAFGRRYREIARPFEWTFTRTDLERVLERVDAQAARDEPARARLRLAA